MTGTNCDLFTHKSSRSYLNHLVFMPLFLWEPRTMFCGTVSSMEPWLRNTALKSGCVPHKTDHADTVVLICTKILSGKSEQVDWTKYNDSKKELKILSHKWASKEILVFTSDIKQVDLNEQFTLNPIQFHCVVICWIPARMCAATTHTTSI
jgi:hypothetical protein